MATELGHVSERRRAGVPSAADRVPFARCTMVALLGLVSIAGLSASGCCAVVPKPEKYFDRTTPHSALRMFQYSVETRQYSSAYECLSASSHERVSLTRFKSLLWLNAEPPGDPARGTDWGGVGIRDFVVDGTVLPNYDTPDSFGPGTYGITVIFDQEGLPGVIQPVTLLLDDDEWFVDLTRLQGSPL